MVSGKVIIKNQTGLHLRPAGLLCKIAIEFNSRVSLRHNEVTANAKSVLGVLGACIKSGDEVEIICEGDDEETALKTILEAIENGLGENIILS